MKWLVGTLAALLTLCGAGWLWLASAEPERSGSFKAAVSNPVEIAFDQRARPFVQAVSWPDAFAAQGWLHARERLWQMEMFRRAGSGRLAELIGRSGLDTDIAIWRAGVPVLARRLERNASPGVLAWVDAYVAGVNSWLGRAPRQPIEFLLLGTKPEAWTRADVFALGALMAYQSANNASNELMRLALIDALGEEAAAIFLPAAYTIANPLARAPDEGALINALDAVALTESPHNSLYSAPSLGSNAWAVAPARSASGKALFAFDSHDSISLPNLTYDVHLFVGDEQVRGNSVPGLPGVINGYNEFLAWGFTNIGDSQDLFVETVDDDDTLRFLGEDGWYDARTEMISIPVAGAEPFELMLIESRNGRLIATDPAISQRWSPLAAPEASLDSLFDLNRATTWAAFKQAMDRFAAPSANVTVADITGRIAQRTIGVLPVRGQGAGLVPLPGHDPRVGWQGLIDPGDLPTDVNPPRNVVFAANRPIHNGAPLVSADNAPGYRVARIQQFLNSEDAHTAQSMQALQTDTRNLQAEHLLPTMLAALDRDALSPLQTDIAQRLAGWANEATEALDSGEALAFATWYNALIDALFKEPLGDELHARLLKRRYLINDAIDHHLLASNAGDWPIDDALRVSFTTAIESLSSRYGSDPADWRWRDEHTLTLKHEMSGAFPGSQRLLDRGPFPAAGGNATVGRARYSYAKPFAVSGGATTRTVIEMSDPMTVHMIMPGGQSGWPLSEHYNDQTEAWLDARFDAIPAHRPDGEHALRLTPQDAME